MEILELQKGQAVYFDEDETNFLTINGSLQKVRKTKCQLCQQMGVEMPHNIFLHSIYIGKDYSPTPGHWCNTQTKNSTG